MTDEIKMMIWWWWWSRRWSRLWHWWMIRDWAVWWCLGGDGGENWGLRISKFNDHDDEISDDLRCLSLQVDSIHGEIGDVLYQFQSVLTTTMTSVMTMRVMGSRPESLVLASREPLTDWRHKGANPTSLKTQRWRHTPHVGASFKTTAPLKNKHH